MYACTTYPLARTSGARYDVVSYPHSYPSWRNWYILFSIRKICNKKSAGHCNIIHQRQTLHMLSCTISCVHRWCILISLHFHSISNVFRTLTIPKIVMLGIVKMYQMYKYTSFSWCYPDISRYFIHIIHQYRILIPLFLPLCVLLD